jgi:hypothetical protein
MGILKKSVSIKILILLNLARRDPHKLMKINSLGFKILMKLDLAAVCTILGRTRTG